MLQIVYFCNPKNKMVVVAQSVRASDCGSEGRGFESRLPPKKTRKTTGFFICIQKGKKNYTKDTSLKTSNTEP